MKQKLLRDYQDLKLQYIDQIFAQSDFDTNKFIDDESSKMRINSSEGKLLFLLIKMHHVKNILEIGTCCGYSTVWLASALPEDGKIITIEKNVAFAEKARLNFINLQFSRQIEIINGDAVEELSKMNNKFFDLIFIDANKSQYLFYLDFATKYLKKNGLLIADNTLLFDEVFDDHKINKRFSKKNIQNMKEFNIRINDKEKFISTMIPTDSGLTISLKIF